MLRKPATMQHLKTTLLVVLSLCGLISLSYGSHLYGGELYYTHLSGNQYKVTMVLYGDCSGSSSLITALYSATPEVKVYNGSSLFRTMYLKVLSGAGAEVTPVCSGSIGSTTCNGGTVPGVRRFAYSDTITLNATSSSWKFHSTGYLTTTSSAGRSSSITNIVTSGGTVMALDATLNNTVQPNSNPVFTTIPTPFFCINVAQEYNPGAVDTNLTDSLSYDLVDGLEPSGSTVTYLTGYSATSPLATATGTFSFSRTTGQLTFTPNLAQKSLVVCRVNEYRGGTLVGTCMREMTFIVLSSCSNRSPYGRISNVVGGTASGNTTVNLCKDEPLLTFDINPVDSDGNNITMSVAGLPGTSTLTITGNGTTTPTSSFSWNTASVAVGSYTFFITYLDNGCPLSSKQTVAYTININPKPAAPSVITPINYCVGASASPLSATGTSLRWYTAAAGGTGSATAPTPSTATSGSTTYYVSQTNSSGCEGPRAGITVTVNPLPAAPTVVSPVVYCQGDVASALSATGTALKWYTAATGGTGATMSPTPLTTSAGTTIYYVSQTTAAGCEGPRAAITVTVNPLPAAPAVVSPVSYCIDDAASPLSATGSSLKWYTSALGGSGSTAAPTPVTSTVATTTYYVSQTNSFGCEGPRASIRVVVNPKPSISVAPVSGATCARKAVFDITPTGGTAPWSITLLSGSSVLRSYSGTGSAFRDSLDPGTYTVSVSNSEGCFSMMTYSIAAPATPVVASLSYTNPLCNRSANGTVTIVGGAALPPYSYSIDGGAFASSGSFSGLAAGIHTLRIRDANLCTKDTSIMLTEPDALSLATGIRNPVCRPLANGSFTARASGGTAPYLYALGTGIYGSSGVFSSLSSGTYTVKVRDAQSCESSFTVILSDSLSVAVTATVKNVSCNGGTDGSITIAPFVGVSPFTYALGTGSFTGTPLFGALKSGTYTVRVKDALGCSMDSTISIAQPTPLLINVLPASPSCFGFVDGAFSATASGGTPPYSFSIDGGAFAATGLFSKLRSATYKLSVRDANNCTRDTTVFLSQPEPLFVDVIVTEPLCNGDANGTIQVNGSGGSGSYTYSYNSSPPQTDALLSGLRAGVYAVQMSDRNGCTKDTTLVMGQPGVLGFEDINIVNPTCEGYADGLVQVIAKGGTAPYRYAIAAGSFQSADSFSRLKQGTYTLRIKDAHDCTAESEVILKGYPAIVKDSNATVPTRCFGTADGALKLYASGGNPPLRYVLTGTTDTALMADYRGLKAGQYAVTVIDATNCTKVFPVAVSQPDPVKVATLVVNNDCTGLDTNGRITAVTVGGTPPYRYRWSTVNRNDSIIRGLGNGLYTVTVADSRDCIDSTGAEIIYDNCCTPSIPNAFTPNGDGRNDVIRIIYKGDIILKEFSIYNRYGQQVFTTDNITQGWDGNFNGREAELGVYYYYARLICGNNKDREVTFKGDISLIR